MMSRCNLEKILNTGICIGFVMLLMGMLALCVMAPSKEKSEMENRTLQKMPELSRSNVMDGSYMKSFETYASDNVAGRNSWVSIKNNIDFYSGKNNNGSVTFGKEGYLFPMDKIHEEQFEKNLAYTKTFAEAIKKQNPQLKLSVLIAPTSSEILKDKLPKYAAPFDQQALLSKASETLGAAFVDVGGELREHEREYIYYRTDHHWTSLGAYYAYVAWAEHCGISPLSVDSFEVEPISEDFYGTSYSKAVGINSKPDTIEKFSNETIEASVMKIETLDGSKKTAKIFDEEYLKTRDKYSYFLSGNNPLSVIETPVKNQKRLLVIKDSYANSFIPFLTTHFEEIYIVDLRYYKENLKELIEKNQISDVIMLYNVVQYSNDRNLSYLALKK